MLEVMRLSSESELSSLSFLLPLLRGCLVFAVCLLQLACDTQQGSYHKPRTPRRWGPLLLNFSIFKHTTKISYFFKIYKMFDLRSLVTARANLLRQTGRSRPPRPQMPCFMLVCWRHAQPRRTLEPVPVSCFGYFQCGSPPSGLDFVFRMHLLFSQPEGESWFWQSPLTVCCHFLNAWHWARGGV